MKSQVSTAARCSLTVAALTIGLAIAPRAVAQAGQSTYAQLTKHADAIVTAKPLHAVRIVRDPSGSHRRVHVVRFKVAERWVGNPPTHLTLSEPAGRTCGRALHALMPGVGYVLFLSQRKDGSFALASGTARAAVPITPERLRHVQGLIASTATNGPGGDRLGVLIRGLSAADGRIRQDSALTLARSPALVVHNAGAQAALETALLAHWQVSFTRGHAIVDPAASALVTATARIDSPVLAKLCAETLTADGTAHPSLFRLAASGATLLSGTTLIPHLAARWRDASSQAKARIAPLLVRLRSDRSTRSWLSRLTTQESPPIAAAATRALIHHNAQWSPSGVSSAVLDAARAEPPQFRFARPRRGPVPTPIPLNRR